MSEEDRLIEENDITWYDRSIVKKNRGAYNFYITTDFATSEKTSSDYSVIAVWALNSNGDWLWVDGIVKKQTMDKNIDDLFRLAQRWKPQSVGIEVSGQQGGFIPWIQKEMGIRNIMFTLASENNSKKPGIRPNTNKMERFNLVVPLFKTNKIWFPKELASDPRIIEFMEEIRLVSVAGFKSKHDDAADTISMLLSLKTWLPSEAAPSKDGTIRDYWDDGEDDDADSINSYIV
jgi:predicted phage terminase large subunit-like protein